MDKYRLLFAIVVVVFALVAIVAHFYFFRTKSVSFFKTKKNFAIATSGVKKIVLNNGMQVLMLKNNSIPKVLVQIAYNIGSYIEKEGERGLAHLLEHMIFKGTNKLSESDIDHIARKYGASYNAYTSIDVTSYYFEVDKNNWRPFVEILADCMQNARFDEQHLASELKAVIQELKMYKDSYWDVMFKKAFEIMFPANHPYHYPVIGYKEDLMNLSADNLKKFYKKYYQPHRATLFVIGDVDHNEVEQIVKENFGMLQDNRDYDVHEFPPLSLSLATNHVRLYEDIATEQLGFFWRIPGLHDKNEILSSAAAYMLGDGEGSRLYRLLVDEKKLASSVGVATYKLSQAGVFYILVEPVAGKIEECRKVIKEEIIRAATYGFTEHELERMVKSEAKSFFTTLQKFTNTAYEWINSYFTTGDEYAFFNHIDKYSAVRSHDVQNFIKNYLNPELFNQIEVLPLKNNMGELSLQAKKESDDLDKKILSKYHRTAPIEAPQYSLTLHEPHPLEFVFPKPDKTFVLSNGLKVILKQNKNLPLITLDCRFKQAFYNSLSLEGQCIDLMMDMLIEGTKGFSKEETVQFFDSLGSDYYFGSSSSGLAMLNNGIKEQVARFFEVLTEPIFPSEALEKVKAIHIDSIMRAKDSPQDLFSRILRSKIYAGHPFGWLFDDAISLLKNTTIKDLKKLHKQHIVAANMLVVIVGDFDLVEMETIIREKFSQLEKGVICEPVYPEISFQPDQKADVAMVRDQLILGIGRPSHLTVYDEDYVPTKLLNYIAFYSLGSRLYQLREQSGLFYNAFGGWASNAGKKGGFDYVGAILSPDKAELAEEQIRNLINEIGQKGITLDELAAARRLYLKSLIDSVSSNRSVALMFGTIEEFNLGFDYYDKVLHRVQTISLEELNSVAKKYFKADGMARVKVGRLL